MMFRRSDSIGFTAHCGLEVLRKRFKLNDGEQGMGDREWLRFLAAEPLNAESLVLTSWGLLQCLRSLLQSLRLMPKLNVYKTISAFLHRRPLVAEVLQGVPNMVAEQCDSFPSGIKAQHGQRDLGDVTTRLCTATSAGARSSDSQHTPRSTEIGQSSVCEQLDP